MKKVRFLSLITILISIVFIVTGYSIIFVNEYRVDAKEKSSYASLIKTSFNSYNTSIEEIAYELKTSDILNNKYFEDIKNNYNNNIMTLTSLENKIKNIESITASLIYECNSRNYYDKDIDYKCELTKYNYENLVNTYVNLVNETNKNINNYNNWSKTNLLKEHQSKYYYEYIDVNLDGNYIGLNN